MTIITLHCRYTCTLYKVVEINKLTPKLQNCLNKLDYTMACTMEYFSHCK